MERNQQNELKTAVVYARYSSDNQTEQSIEGQLRVCQEYATRNNIIILDTYIDRAMTGTNDNRPDFQRMIRDSSKKQWDYVLVYKLDRFSRNKYESSNYKYVLKNNGVKVISACENIPETPEGIILESMLEGMNQYYSAELSQKVKRGMRETRIKGNFQGGHLLYGYKVEEKKIYIDEEQAVIVQYLFEQYANGVHVDALLKELREKHITDSGKPFTRSKVYGMLKNEKYIGICKHEDEIFDNIYPQIVPNSLFERVKEKQKKYKYGRKSTSTEYLLCRKLKCGYCGNSINAECGTAKSGKKKHYYKCLGRKRNQGCNKSILRKDYLEDTVISSIMEALSDEKVVNYMIKSLLNAQKESSNNIVLNSLLSTKRKSEEALNNLLKALERGVMSNTTNKRINELEKTVEDLERQIAIERNKCSNELTEDIIREYIEKAIKLEIKAMLNVLIKEIELFDDKIVIYYNKPNAISPDESRGLCFLTEEKDGYIIEMYI